MEATYNVMIALAAQNAVSGVLAVIAKDVLGVHGNVKELEKGFAAWQPAIAGAAAAIAGIKLGEMVAGVVEAGAKLEHFKAQMLAATGDIGKVADATNLAWQETTRNLNSSVSENVKNIQHLMNVTGSFDEAKRMLHPFTMADTALASLKDDELRSKFTGPGAEMNTYNLARSLEQLGVTQDDEKINSYLQGMTRAMVAERGLVDGSKFFNAIQNAGAPRADWNEDFVEKGLAPLIQATNGRIGAQLYQLDRSFGQGVSTKMMAEGAEKYGLWSEGDEVWEAGKFKGMKVGSVFEDDVRKKNPVQWAGDVREMLRKRGVNVDDTDTMMGVIDEVTRGNKNLGAGMSELIMPNAYNSLMKERRNIENVPDDAVQTLQSKDPSLALKAFHTQWDNLMQSVGSPLVESATKLLNSVAEALNFLAREAAAHPDAVKAAGVVLVGVAAGLTALGTVLVGGAVLAAFGGTVAVGGAVGGIVAGLTALGVGIVAFSDKITGAWDGLKNLLHLGNGDASAIPGGPIGHPTTTPDIPLSSAAGKQLLNGLGMTPGMPGYPAGFSPMSFGGISNDNNPLTDAVYGGFMKAFREIQGGGAGGADVGGGAGGVISAAYTTYGGGGGGGGAGSIGGSTGGVPASGNVDAILNRAGLTGFNTRGVRNMNIGNIGWGAWAKAHGAVGGAGSDTGHLVAVFPSFEAGSAAAGALAMSKYQGGKRSIDALIAGAGGWTPGNHAAAANVARMMGISPFADAHLDDPAAMERFKAGLAVQELGPAGARYARDHMRGVPLPPRSASPAHPPINVHMDGKIVAQLVSKRQGVGNRFPTRVGGVDSHGNFINPGTPLFDVA